MLQLEAEYDLDDLLEFGLHEVLPVHPLHAHAGQRAPRAQQPAREPIPLGFSRGKGPSHVRRPAPVARPPVPQPVPTSAFEPMIARGGAAPRRALIVPTVPLNLPLALGNGAGMLRPHDESKMTNFPLNAPLTAVRGFLAPRKRKPRKRATVTGPWTKEVRVPPCAFVLLAPRCIAQRPRCDRRGRRGALAPPAPTVADPAAPLFLHPLPPPPPPPAPPAQQEDDKLVQLVTQFGAKRWPHIASQLGGRIDEQCRQRWFHQLDPAVRKDPFTKEEDQTILDQHKAQGNSWAKMAKLLNGRTAHDVANRFNNTLKRALLAEGADSADGGAARKRPRATGKSKNVEAWELKFAALEAYAAGNGDDPNCPSKHMVTTADPAAPLQLGVWLNTQRQAYKVDKLSETRKQLLTNLGVAWPSREPVAKFTVGERAEMLKKMRQQQQQQQQQ